MASSSASVILNPSSLVFHVHHGSAPQTVVTISNMYADRAIAFKVMTTRPLGYLVQPNQGVLNPNSSISVVIILQQGQCDQMLLMDMINDEFLVQSVDLGAGFCDLAKREPKQNTVNKLLNLQTQKDKQVLCNQKLHCYFVGGFDREEELKPAGTAVTSLPQPSRLRGIPPVKFEWAIGDAGVHLKRKKRDKLKKLVAQLTSERDKLISDLSNTQQRLQRAVVETQRLDEALEEAFIAVDTTNVNVNANS
ncbi:hypothetical protein V7S43_009975 [Phytophthora oleae]|uniref:MSP domain-containing protein n=1 Tax=Phytophthora oleae TaxID=2107226 RepID=A0ABD3FGY1_9STRA